MTALIEELRGMGEAGTADYTAGTTSYWSDNALQDILDIHRVDVVHEQLQSFPTIVTGGSLSYRDYRSASGYFEATTGGTDIFYVQNGGGTTVGTATYTPDYRRGQVIFGSDQAGTVYYLTGRSYDLDAAAADLWRRKASHYANSFDFSTDNHSVSRSQVYQHCLDMAAHFEGKSTQAVEVGSLFRGDID
jgi:hypothetical protein